MIAISYGHSQHARPLAQWVALDCTKKLILCVGKEGAPRGQESKVGNSQTMPSKAPRPYCRLFHVFCTLPCLRISHSLDGGKTLSSHAKSPLPPFQGPPNKRTTSHWATSYNYPNYSNLWVPINMGWGFTAQIKTSHNITRLMGCVHGPNNRFENKDSGCWNPSASH